MTENELALAQELMRRLGIGTLPNLIRSALWSLADFVDPNLASPELFDLRLGTGTWKRNPEGRTTEDPPVLPSPHAHHDPR